MHTPQTLTSLANIRLARKLLAVALSSVSIVGVNTAVADAAGESCPSAPTGSAAVQWGINGVEQLGAGFRDNRENVPRAVLGLSGIRSVRVGFKFSLAILSNCSVVSWGSNTKLQLGNGKHAPSQAHPGPVVNLSQVKEVAAGNAHAMALGYNGVVSTWGASEFGERGNGESNFERAAREQQPTVSVPRDEPVRVPGLEHVAQIAAGGTADYALLSDGEVLAWGEDVENALGIEVPSEEEESCYGETHALAPVPCSTIPRPVKLAGKPLTGVEAIAAGEEAAYAIRDGGRQVVAWGANTRGELGDGGTQPSSGPVVLPLETSAPVVEIAAGLHHALARVQDGHVYAWGGDASGQLGVSPASSKLQECGGSACATYPIEVPQLSGVVQVAAGESNSLALKEEAGGKRVPYTFGAGGFEEVLGLGEAIQSVSAPTPIQGLPSVGEIATSATTGLAFLQSGSAPSSVLTVTSEPTALKVNWTLSAHEFRIRYRPMGVTKWSKFVDRSGSCEQEGSCHYSLALSGLAPEPYELALVSIPSEGKAKTRYVAATPLPAPGAPANSAAPSISASPRVGSVVSASVGAWTNSPTSFTYQWLRCGGLGEDGSEEALGAECEPIEGAVSSSYTPTEADVGHSLLVKVIAVNSSGWSVAISTNPEVVVGSGEEGLPLAPVAVGAPTISGSGAQGTTLTVLPAGWEHQPASFTYKWMSCKGVNLQGQGATCVLISGASSASYTVTASVQGRWIEATETARNAGGFASVVSNAVHAG